jgi:hemolysin III
VKYKLKDPFSGLTHLAGALLGVVALIYLVYRSLHEGTSWHVVSYTIFGLSLIGLYSSSAFYHLLPLSEEKQLVLRRVDHSMIFFLIAGSYTPFCLVSLRDTWGWPIFIVVWTLAALGVLQSFFWIHAPRWLTTGLYLFMGWIALIAIYPLSRALTYDGLYWLFAGGILYSIGAIIYAVKWPDPFPPHFGFHEIWHLFVLAGSAGHFLSLRTLL